MSYDFTIGNAVPYWPGDEDAHDCDDPEPGWTVEEVALDEAPTFEGDVLTLNTNTRAPGYSQWADFVRDVGLRDLLGSGGDLLPTHPGIAVLRPGHLARVRDALAEWKSRHKGAPGWGAGQDGNLARLLWLEWWMDWALRTCERPAVSNS